MTVSGDLDVSAEHPLASELSSLRAAVTRFQDEAYSSSLKLQRHSLEVANTHDRISQLQRENELLKSELAILRANPHPDASSQAHPAVQQAQQLTLALRKLSDKLSLTEQALWERTTQLAQATGEAAHAKLTAESAYELAARTRGREEAGKSRELELEWKVKAAEEAAKMSDLVVNEYADLVRALEAKAGTRPSMHSPSISSSSSSSSSLAGASNANTNSTPSLADILSAGKLGLQRLLSEFSTATEKLQAEIVQLHGELAASESKREAERKGFDHSRVELGKAQFDLQQLKLDDNAAAKMVSRYMKFSQKSANLLQDAMTTLKTRHTATVETLTGQLSQLSSQLHFSESQTEKLRRALDELGGELMKEAYGRRMEVALRIRMVNREEKLREDLERWVLRAEEAVARDPADARLVHGTMVQGARAFLLNALGGASGSSSGSLARMAVAQKAVENLTAELEFETARRLETARLVTLQEVGIFEDRDLSMNHPLSDPPSERSTASSHHKPTVDALRQSSVTSEVSVPLVEVHSPNAARDLQTKVHAASIVDVQGTSRPSNVNGGVENDISVLEQHPESLPVQNLVLKASQRPLPPSPKLDEHLIDAQVSPIVPGLTLSEEVPHATSGIGEKEVQQATVPLNITPTYDILPDATTADFGLAVPEIPVLSDETTEQETRYSLHQDDGHDHLSLSQPIIPQLPPVTASGTLSPLSSLSSPQILAASPLLVSMDHSPNNLNVSQRNPHPLIAELRKTHRRYDDLQRAFRDCHITLEALTKNVPSGIGTATSSASSIPSEVLRVALQRLNDYTEDARVELEIRTADETLVVRGFETLLSVPGALSSPSTSSLSSAPPKNDVAPSQPEVEAQVEAFIAGTDSSVEKARGSLSRKLEDIQHDIAVLKRAIHDEFVPPSPPQTAPATNGNTNGGGWSSWIRSSPSTPSSATTGMGPAPTFGNVMTAPRLRHSPSLNFPTQSSRKTLGEASNNPLASLGLKVPMPGYVPHVTQVPPPRSRTVSTMYMLGLGARRPTGSFPSPSPKEAVPSLRLQLQDTETNSEDDTDVDEEIE
ncbi:hypothetical protein Hypma_009785 [Hypsizygus marmoreus]|uniref:Uncharacterized protein n=1 Tax=Hypsizygus marmoreus TaxID=39966 RepID=A0A369JLB9_HYPMA|nr:hypothetical protein Hypma_009785 [Hypsizygus marmoreus]